MTQTSGVIEQTKEIEQRVDAKRSATFIERVERHFTSTWLLCILVGVVALGFDLYHLGTPSIWFDEAFSVELARQPLPLLWHIIWRPEPNMELYYLFLHFWLGLTGFVGLHATEFVVRFPSAVFAALSSVMVFLLGRRFLGTIAGLVGAGLYIFNSFQLTYAQQTRAYSLQLLLTCIAWYALFTLLSRSSHDKRWWRFHQQSGADEERTRTALAPTRRALDALASTAQQSGKSRGAAPPPFPAQPLSLPGILLTPERWWNRWWICYIAATTLAIYAHLFTLVILLAQIMAFAGLLIIPSMWRATARKQFPVFIVSLAVIGLLSIPMLLVSLHGAKTGWLPIPRLGDIYNLFIGYSANSKLYMLVLFGFCTLGLLIAALVYLPGGRLLLEQFALYNTEEYKRNAMLQQYLPVACGLFCWVVVPVVFSYVVSHGSTRLFSTRYLVTILPALFLLVGLGVASLRWRVVQVVLTLALLLIALHYVPAYYKDAQIENWNTTVHWLQQRYQPGDGLVCYDSDVEQGCQVSVEYYLHAYPSGAHFSGDSPGEFSWTNFGPANPRLGTESAVDPSALAAYASQHSHFFYIIGRTPNDAVAARAKAAQNWLDSHYRLLGRVVTGTVTISWYARA